MRGMDQVRSECVGERRCAAENSGRSTEQVRSPTRQRVAITGHSFAYPQLVDSVLRLKRSTHRTALCPAPDTEHQLERR